MADTLAWIGVIGGTAGGAAAVYTAIRARSIERYRAKLKAEGFEHEIRFERLHERRVEVVADLYQKLVEAEVAFARWVHPLQEAGDIPIGDKSRLAADAGNALMSSFRRSRIWLEEDLCKRFDDFNQRLVEAFVGFTTYDPNDPNVRKEHLDAWKIAWDKVSKDVPALRNEIEGRFREMLGVVGPP